MLVLVLASTIYCQQRQTPFSWNIAQAVDAGLRNYPSILVSQEQINAASAKIQLARTAYLPRVDTLAQINRATRNNVFGLLLPQSIIPSISGPVIGTNNFGTVWDSAVGGLVTWEPFDFGARKASISAARAARAHSETTLKRTRYEVAVSTAEAFLTLVAAEETARAAQAGVDRAEVVLRTITAQVKAQLRPGADQSRAEAELAASQTQLAQAHLAADIARANLAQFTSTDPTQINALPAHLLELPPQRNMEPLFVFMNPVVQEQNAAIEELQAQLRVLERSYFPRFYVQGAAYARGSGAEMNGGRLGGVKGLGPSIQDYAIGLTVTFPVFDLPAIRAREAAQSASIRAERARYEQLTVDLRSQWNTAAATLNAARSIAANTPVQVKAAAAAASQASARYQSGLGNIDEVAEAQRLLTQAEIDDALARLKVWRGLLEIAAAAGDLQPFLEEATQ